MLGGKGIDRRGDLSKAGLRPSVQASFGGKGIRTPDIQLAKLALYQLSYAPGKNINHPDRALAEGRAQKLNCGLYVIRWSRFHAAMAFWNKLHSKCSHRPECPVNRTVLLLRKEVIQPQVPLRLPCYDFIPVTAHSVGRCLLAVGLRTSGTNDFHDVTGGVYKARERIHGAVADAPLLAIPASWRRVAASNPNWARLW